MAWGGVPRPLSARILRLQCVPPHLGVYLLKETNIIVYVLDNVRHVYNPLGLHSPLITLSSVSPGVGGPSVYVLLLLVKE